MPTSRYLLSYLTEGQAQKEISISTVYDQLDRGLAGYLTKSVAGSSNVTLTAQEWEYRMLQFTGALTGDIAIIVPATTRLFQVYNHTTGAFTLTVRTSGGTGVVVLTESKTILYSDGTDVFNAISFGPTTLTSITIKDADFILQDDSDITKQLLFQLAGITTGTTRTLTVPDATDTLAVLAAIQTLSNKRITRRVVTLTDAATVTMDADTMDMGILTTLSQATNFANPTGTPTDGQLLELRIKSTSSWALTWGTQFRGSNDLVLPVSTTGGSKTDYLGFQWNVADTKLDLLSKNFGF